MKVKEFVFDLLEGGDVLSRNIIDFVRISIQEGGQKEISFGPVV
jgi:hypothetical protein